MNDLDVLDDAALAHRWFIDKIEGITPEAIAKRLDRITNKKRAGHLKSFKGGHKRLYRIEDVREYEARAKHFASSLHLGNVHRTADEVARVETIDAEPLHRYLRGET